MSNVQVLITTMHQNDFTKYHTMNLQTDAVIANQSNIDKIEEKIFNGKKIRLVTTKTRGLSKNRNIAIENCFLDDEYILFSDDDLVFHQNYEKIICKEFDQHPEANAIKFNLNCISNRKLSMKSIEKFHRLNRREITAYGVCGVVLKRNILLDKKLVFNEKFGAGTDNYCGEDTIFLQDLCKKKVRFYASPQVIADIDQSDSCWFTGYTAEYFVCTGKIIATIYPVLAYLIVIRSAIRAQQRGGTKLSFSQILKCYYKGIWNSKV